MQVVALIIFPFNSWVQSLQKLYETWRMKGDYYKLNKAVAPITAALPGVLSLVEQVNVDLGT